MMEQVAQRLPGNTDNRKTTDCIRLFAYAVLAV
jgi:hypothetical protein